MRHLRFIELILAIVFCYRLSSAQAWTNLDDYESLLLRQTLAHSTSVKTSPNPNPASAVLEDDSPINTNSCIVEWTPYDVYEIIVWDGPASGQYNESNVVYTQDGFINTCLVETTNNLPLFFSAQAEDELGDMSDLGNEIWFNGYVAFEPTNWLFISNLTAIGRDLRQPLIPTNSALAVFTNDPGPLFFRCSGYSAFMTYYLELAPLP